LASITQQGINKLLLQAINQTIEASQGIVLPDMSGHDYDVEHISFKYIGFQNISVGIIAENQVSIQLIGGTMDGTIGRIEVKKGFIKTHCDAHPFDLEQVNIQAVFNVDISYYGGIPTIGLSLASSNASVGNVDVDIHGNIICDAFKGEIESRIKSAVIDQFPTLAPASLAEDAAYTAALLNANFTTVSVNIPLDISLLNLELIIDVSPMGCGVDLVNNDPTGAAASLWLKGSFFTKQTSVNLLEAPYVGDVPAQFLPTMTSDIQACMSEYVANSLGWILYESGTLVTSFTKADLPPNSPLQLNTSNIIMKQISPQLDTLYPNCGMSLLITFNPYASNTSAPIATVIPNGISFSLATNVLFQVETPNDVQPGNCVANDGIYLCNAFALQLQLGLNISQSIQENETDVIVTAKITGLSLQWEFIESNVGSVQSSILNSLSRVFIPTVLSELNALLAATEIAVPKTVENVLLENFSNFVYVPVERGNGFMCLGFDASLVN